MSDFNFNFDALGPSSDEPNSFNSNEDEIPPEVWVPDRAITAINMERQYNPELSEEQLANKILRENLPLVAMGLTHTAKYSGDPRLRLQAQTYVMDRVLGKVGTNITIGKTPTEDLIEGLMQQVEEFANSSQEN